MSRVKLILLAILAVAALSAVGSSSASASCGSGTLWVFCNDAEPMEEIHELDFLGLSPAGNKQILTGTITGAEARFECEDVHVLGTLELLGLATFHLLYLQCAETKPAGCSLNSTTIETKPHLMGTTINTPPTAPQLLIAGEGPNEEFTTLHVINCVEEGEYNVEGLQIAELPEPESMKINHEIVAKKVNSKLKLGGNTASYSGIADIHLHDELPFGLLPGK